jgi:hypothetical protein
VLDQQSRFLNHADLVKIPIHSSKTFKYLSKHSLSTPFIYYNIISLKSSEVFFRELVMKIAFWIIFLRTPTEFTPIHNVTSRRYSAVKTLFYWDDLINTTMQFFYFTFASSLHFFFINKQLIFNSSSDNVPNNVFLIAVKLCSDELFLCSTLVELGCLTI